MSLQVPSSQVTPPRHSKKKHPHATNESTRTTSREKLKSGKKDNETNEVATALFRVADEASTRISVDLSKRPVKTSTKSSVDVDSSTSSNYSEHSDAKVQSVSTQIVRVVTPFDQEREESLKLYEEAVRKHNRLIRKKVERKPMTDAEEAELQQAALETHRTLHQLHYNENIPVDRYDSTTPYFALGEGINFFSPKARDTIRGFNFQGYNQFLNDMIGLVNGEKHIMNNARKLAHFMSLGRTKTREFLAQWKPVIYSTDPTANRTAEYNAFLERYQKQLSSLMTFEKRLRSICKNLNGEKDVLGNTKAQEFCNAVRTKCAGKEDMLLRATVEAIQFHYQPYELDNLVSNKAHEIFTCHQHYHPSDAILKEKAAEKWGEDFKTSPMPNQMTEWKRAIYGPDRKRGIVSFLDAKGNVLLGPFQMPERSQRDAHLNEYVLNCQYVVGERLYNDGLLMQKLCALIQEDTNLEAPPKPNESLLKGQKRIMDHLTAMSGDVPRFMRFIGNIVYKLNVWNATRGAKQGPEVTIEKVLDMQGKLMEFYRAPYQKFVIGPTTNLRLAFPMVYPKLRVDHYLRDLPKRGVVKEEEVKNEEEGKKVGYEANRIDITFMPHSLDVVYHTPSLICAKKTKATYTLIQKMSLKTHLGEDKKTVEVEFLYEVPDGLSKDDIVRLDKSRDKVNVVLRAMNYPPLQQQVTKKI